MSSVTDGQEFASIGGDFSLTAGESLQIAVGGAGLGVTVAVAEAAAAVS